MFCKCFSSKVFLDIKKRLKIPRNSSETVKNRQYNDQDTTEVIRNRKGQTIQ